MVLLRVLKVLLAVLAEWGFGAHVLWCVLVWLLGASLWAVRALRQALVRALGENAWPSSAVAAELIWAPLASL